MKRLFYIGIGYQRGVPGADILALAVRCCEGAGISPGAVAAVSSLDRKAADGILAALGRHFDCEIRCFSPAELEAETPRLKNPSEIVFREIGCHGVAEAAALAAAGPQAELVVPKTTLGGVTCAIARRRGHGR